MVTHAGQLLVGGSRGSRLVRLQVKVDDSRVIWREHDAFHVRDRGLVFLFGLRVFSLRTPNRGREIGQTCYSIRPSDANILIRAVLGRRVRQIITTHAEHVSFFAPAVANDEASAYLPTLLAK